MNLVKYGRKIFNPTKLVEHIPGQKRVYLNRLTGTKTEFTLGDEFTVKDYVKSANDFFSSKGCKEVDSLYLHPIDRVPKNMLVPNYEQGRMAFNVDEIPLDTPVTITPFERVKSYLFGLIKEKPTGIITVNIADKFRASGEVFPEYIMGFGNERCFAGGSSVYLRLPSRSDGISKKTFSQTVRRRLVDRENFSNKSCRMLLGTEEKPTKLAKFLDRFLG